MLPAPMMHHLKRRSDGGMRALQVLELTLPVLRIAERTFLAPRRPSRHITLAGTI